MDQAFDGKVVKLVLIGATKEKIAKEAEEKGFTDIIKCESLEEAVSCCHDNARPGRQCCFRLLAQAGICL